MGLILGLLAMAVFSGKTHAQTVTVNIVRPLANGFLTRNDAALYVAATASGTYEIQRVQATLGGQTAAMSYSTSAWTNCPLGVCGPVPGWAAAVPVAGLPWGVNVLTVTAVDALGNSNSVQRTVVVNRLPYITTLTLAEGTVARPEVAFSVSASDDDPSGVAIDVFRDRVNNSSGTLLASGTNNLNTSLSFAPDDGGIVTLTVRVMDSAGQTRETYRRIYVQSSSNLVEIAHASEGQLVEAQGDRLLFRTFSNPIVPPEFWTSSTLKTKSQSAGTETNVFVSTNMNVGTAFLSSEGATFVASGSPFAGYSTGYGMFLARAGAELLLGTQGGAGIALQREGNFAAWGWGNGFGFPASIFLTDLQNTNTVAIPNSLGSGGVNFDLAANSDIVFTPVNGFGSHAIYRFRNGTNTLLAAINGSYLQATNQLVAPRTDGSNVFFIQITPTNQILKRINAAGEVTLATGAQFGTDYQINNGWVAYGRNNSGTTQIWRCSPAGINTQLTFSGTGSSLAALAPNGEVAFYNGAKLYLSKGTATPVEIATATSSSGLTVFWQEGRWLGMLGRSLFQIYSGAPELFAPRLAGNNFGLGLVGPKGRYLVVECSTNFVDWKAISTNYITDGAVHQTSDVLAPNISGKVYRVRLQ